MTVYYVTHIREDGRDPDRRIDRLKGHGWEDTIDKIIYLIEHIGHEFRSSANGRSELIGVYTSIAGRKYLRTMANGYWNDNLLALPRF
jgi:hypothetical protein